MLAFRCLIVGSVAAFASSGCTSTPTAPDDGTTPGGTGTGGKNTGGKAGSPAGTGGVSTGAGGATAGGAGTGGKAAGAGAAGAGGGGAGTCTPCISSADCGAGKCAQFGGDSYCAPMCGSGCPAGQACTMLNTAEGDPYNLCVPVTACGSGTGGTGTGGTGAGGAGVGGTASAGAPQGAGGSATTCGPLLGPSVASCCTSCSSSGQSCQTNGCYGGWWCNSQTCKCQSPPTSCGSAGAGGSGQAGTGPGGSSAAGGGSGIGPTGGTLATLSFAVVGDTRPPVINDTTAYPTQVIDSIWKQIEGHSPRPAFAVSTGDYMFASPSGTEGAKQLDLYLGARASYSNVVFPAFGNHECTGATNSNCGPGNTDGITNNYTAFLQKMLQPYGISKPYYKIDVAAPDGSWTAKFVFVAANAWDATQAAWLDQTLAAPTTYTFMIRHEGSIANTAPGVTPSGQALAAHPKTLLIVGHTHTYEYFKSEGQMVVGNGGAPLSATVNYGYVLAHQRPDGAMQFDSYDYGTGAIIQTFAVKADGTPTP